MIFLYPPPNAPVWRETLITEQEGLKMAYIAGLDIGGTKLAVLLAKAEDGVVTPPGQTEIPHPQGGLPPGPGGHGLRPGGAAS